ncbi:MAG: hypothetical protein CVU44_00645 [Chloroflexi bacterium HGW-Chloroflexi-6]|nr:MAG: hypothetical protein CVU44_00645 [Chloroflexi bacterium HGW-Chloroflexi-6]
MKKFLSLLLSLLLLNCLSACFGKVATPTKVATITASPSPTTVPPAHLDGDKAQETLTQAEQAILTAYKDDQETPLSQYPYYYRAAWYAAWNALLDFPDDPRAEIWKWKMAYYSAMGGGKELAFNTYVGLITQALNEKKVTVSELPSWFQSGEIEQNFYTPQFTLEIQPVNIPGNELAYLIQLGELEDIDTPGSACFLVTQNAQTAAVFPVFNGFADNGYFPMLRNPTYCSLVDFTNDGLDEIIINNWYGGHAGTTTIRILDISSLPPKTLPFTPSQENQISVWNGNQKEQTVVNGKTQLPVFQQIGQCDSYLTRYFEWNGTWFEVQKVELSREGVDTDFQYCVSSAVWLAHEMDTPLNIQLLEQITKFYKPPTENDKNVLDEIKIRKGLAYLFSDQPNEARLAIQDVVQNPIAQNGIWVEPARNFLKIYQTPDTLYRACFALDACDPSRAGMMEGQDSCLPVNPCLEEGLEMILTRLVESKSLDQVTNDLKKAGVEITSEGWFDLDTDEQDELWFVSKLPGTQGYLNLWIASGYPNGVYIFDAGAFQNTIPDFKIEQITPYRTWFELDDDNMYVWSRDQITDIPTFESQTDRDDVNYDIVSSDLETIEQLQNQLYTNTDVTTAYAEMLKIAERYDVCPYEISGSFETDYDGLCGDYYYTLGFAAELAGDKETSKRMYEKVLTSYPDHPVALLASQKLVQAEQ